MIAEQGAEVGGVAGQDVGARDHGLGGDERVDSVGTSGATEQRAGEAGRRLVGREHVDGVPHTMDESVPRTAAQDLGQHDDGNPDVEPEFESARQRRASAHVTAA